MTRRHPAHELLRLLSQLPLLDRLELAAISGWSRSAVYRSVEALERDGLLSSVSHAAELIAPTRRYSLTAAGLRRLAEMEGERIEQLLRERPVSEQARRLLSGRIDALAVLYRLISTLADIAYPIRVRCYRALPLDACARLPDGRSVALLRLGRSNDRSSLAKRLGRLRDGPAFAAVLLLAPDQVRLRYAARRVAAISTPCYLALGRDAAAASAESRIWRTLYAPTALSLREALGYVLPLGPWPAERPLTRVTPPGEPRPRAKALDWMLADPTPAVREARARPDRRLALAAARSPRGAARRQQRPPARIAAASR